MPNRPAYEAWNEGGAESIKRFLAEDVEFHDPPDLPDGRVIRGREAVAAYLASQTEVIGEMKFTIVEVEERGAQRDFANEAGCRGAGSGLVFPTSSARLCAALPLRVEAAILQSNARLLSRGDWI